MAKQHITPTDAGITGTQLEIPFNQGLPQINYRPPAQPVPPVEPIPEPYIPTPVTHAVQTLIAFP